MSESNNDIILSLVDDDSDDKATLSMESKNRKLRIEEIKLIENKHWYYRYRFLALKKMLKQVIGEDSGKEILDIGIGSGKVSNYLQSLGNVTYGEKNLKTIAFVQSQYDFKVNEVDLPWMIDFEQESFDYITLLNTLEYIDNDDMSISVLYKLLKDDGKLILSTLVNKSMFSLNDKTYGILRRYDKNEIEQMLNDNGLTIEKYILFEPSIKSRFKILKDKFLREEDIYLSYIPEDNNELFSSLKAEIGNLGVNKTIYGNQAFIVARKMTIEESKAFIASQKKETLLNKMFNKKDDQE